MACYMGRNWQIRLLCGSAYTLLGIIHEIHRYGSPEYWGLTNQNIFCVVKHNA